MGWFKSRQTAPASARPNKPSRLLLQALEPRLMFDGAAVQTAMAALHADVPHPAPERAEAPAAERLQEHAVPPAAAAPEKQVVFVDASLANYQGLLAQLPRGAEVVLLDPGKDGLAQIIQWAGSHRGYAAMHILSHGQNADLLLGNTALTPAALEARQGELAALGSALQPGGDILLYGCNIGAGAQGAAFVARLAELSHADVAASSDATGAARLGGNWNLERHSGRIDATILQLDYDGLLAQPSAGLTDFNGIPESTLVAGSSTGAGLRATNVAGWDLLLKSNSAVACYIGAGAVSGQSTLIYGANDDGEALSYLQVSSNNGAQFTLKGVDIAMAGLLSGTSGNMVLVGYRNGVAVAGAFMGMAVTDLNIGGQLVNFNVSNNSNFQSIDSFRVQSDGSFQVTSAIGVDNIRATDFHAPGPVLGASAGNSSYSAGNGVPVAVDGGITLSSTASFNQTSATVTIANYAATGAQDVLAFNNNSSLNFGNIVGSFNSATGVLTLASSGASASNAQWQAALEAVTYQATPLNPNTTTRNIIFAITDAGNNTSTAVFRSVALAANAAPVISGLNGDNITYTAGGGAVRLDSGSAVTVSDADTPNFNGGYIYSRVSTNPRPGEDVLGIDTSGTVSLSNGTSAGSIVSVAGVAVGTIASNGDGIGGHDFKVDLNSNATQARVTALAAALTYNDSAASPNTATRTVQVVVADGRGQYSSAASISVAMINAPVLGISGGSAAFVAGDNSASTPVAVDGGLTVTDPGSSTLASAKVAITGNFRSGEDILSFSNDGASMGNITASYDAGTGELTLTSAGATATLAQWQAALRAVTYTDSRVTPDTASRSLSFQVTDGNGNASAIVTRTLTVTATDQTPIATTSGGSAAFTSGDNAAGTPVVVDAGITLSDLDNSTLASATVAITGNFRSGEDALAFSNTSAALYGNIVATYNSGSGVLSMTSAGATATLAQWQMALSAVRYSDSAAMPHTATRTVSFAVSDGTKTSAAATRQVSVAAAVQTPIVTSSGGSTAFAGGDNGPAVPVAVDGGLTLSDLDSSTLASATVAITGNFRAGEDVLAFSNTSAALYGNIAHSYNAGTGVLTLTSSGATATLAQWQAALRAVSYTDSAATPNTATRTVSFTVSDGGKTSASVGKTVTVSLTDQTPIATTSAGSAAFTSADNAAGSPVVVDGGITLSDRDNSTLASATVSITGNFQAGEDVLAFSNTSAALYGNIMASYDSGTGVLSMTSAGATATVAQWQAALRAVSYGDSKAVPNMAARTVSFAVSDGSKTSAAATRQVTLAAAAQTPVLGASAGSTAFASGDNTASVPVAVDSGLTLSDRDSLTLASATVAITGNFHAGEDVLAFVNSNAALYGNIGASYDSASGVLSLTSAGATATLAQWQAALRAVSYTDSAVTPQAATRTISFSVDDGGKTSASVSKAVSVSASSQSPIATTSGGSAVFAVGDNAGGAAVVVDGGITLSDRDSLTLASATVAITGNFRHGEDVLAFVNAGAGMGNIVGSYNAGSGVLTLTSAGATATVAQWQAALRAVTYADSAATPAMAARTVAFSVNDGGRDSQPVTRAVQLSVPTPQIDGLAADSDTGASASDGVTANASPTLGGKAMAGAQVVIWVDGVALDSTTADGSGNWRYAFASALSDGTHQVRAVTRSGGVDSQPSTALTLRIDTQAPASPADIKLSSGTAGRPAINGKAEAGSTVTVLVDGVEAGKVKADGSGAWAWQGGTALADGQHRISAVATDLAGNASAATTALAFTVDTRIPLPPAPPPPALGLAPGSDTGSSASDGLTSQNRPTVSGTAQAGSTVTVYVDGAVAGAVRAEADGAWRYTVGMALADGQHSITAVAENAGGKSAASAALALSIDTAAPGAPAIAGLGENPAQPQFSGSAEANSSVTIYIDNAAAGTVQADASGRWTYQPSGLLAEGAHTVRAVAVDAAGNAGASSAARSWTVDSRPPAAPTSLGLAAGSDTGASASDGLTSARQPLIQGTAAAGSRITISIDGVAAGSVMADAQGAWSFRPGADLADGQHRVTAQALNAAGVGSAASAPLLLTIDTAAPRLLAITALDASASPGGSLRYDVQFSKAVALTADAFGLALAGGAQARIVSITPSGEGRYVVQLSASGEGSVALALRQGGASDLAGNVLGQGGSGSAYQLQAPPPPPPPSVAEIRPGAGSQPGNGSRPADDSGGSAHAGTPIVPTIVLDTVAATGEPLWLGHSAAAGGMPALATPAWGLDRFAAGGVSEVFSGSAVPGFVLGGFHDMGTRALEQGSSFEIRLPAETPGARAAQPGALVRVQLSDGRALPGWLRYDAQAGRIVGKVPPGWQQDLTLEVRSVDEAGHEHVTQLKLRPGAPAEVKAKAESGKEAPAKAAFNEQLRQYGKDAFEQQLAAWLSTDEAA